MALTTAAFATGCAGLAVPEDAAVAAELAPVELPANQAFAGAGMDVNGTLAKVESPANQAFAGAGMDVNGTLAPVNVAAEEEGGLNLFKWGQPQTETAEGWQTGDRMLALRDQGSPQLNWQQNSSALRFEMRSGQPIFDSYVDPITGGQIPTGGFLNAERNLLESHDWQFNPTTGAYHSPGS